MTSGSRSAAKDRPFSDGLGLLNPGIAYPLSLLGLTMITASLSVFLWAFEPLMILVLAAWFLYERITPTLVVLSLIAVMGMALIVYDPSASGQLIGVALTLAGVACCAAYTVIARRWIPGASETSQVVLAQQGTPSSSPWSSWSSWAWQVARSCRRRWTPLGLASAVGSGVI